MADFVLNSRLYKTVYSLVSTIEQCIYCNKCKDYHAKLLFDLNYK